MRKALITIGSDGLRDYVTLPDGQKLILGTVSVLRFVTELVPHARMARVALNAFLSGGQALVTVDLDRMYELLAPRRARWSSATIPLVGGSNRTPTQTERQNMAANTVTKEVLLHRLGKIEQTISKLEKHASEGLLAPKLHSELRELAANIHLPNVGDQSKNDAWYVKGEPTVDTVEGGEYNPPASVTHPKTASAEAPSYETLQSNTTLADSIIEKVEATNTKVDQLVTAGRKFNASKAKDDLFVIASRVTEILNNVDLAQPWVRNDLTALAKRADHIHGLFASAKV